MEVHARPVRRSCDCVGLSESAWYRTPLDWTVRDAELIAALADFYDSLKPEQQAKVRELMASRGHGRWGYGHRS